MASPKIFVFTGPESTGKTTLARKLSKQLGATLVPEYARFYLEKNGANYNADDFLEMLKGQIALEERLIASTSGIVICDTDVLTFKIWSEDKFHTVDKMITKRLLSYQERIYLLCLPDIEWKNDAFRENPNDGMELFEQYRLSLDALKFKYCIVSGQGKERMKNALVCIENHLKN